MSNRSCPGNASMGYHQNMYHFSRLKGKSLWLILNKGVFPCNCFSWSVEKDEKDQSRCRDTHAETGYGSREEMVVACARVAAPAVGKLTKHQMNTPRYYFMAKMKEQKCGQGLLCTLVAGVCTGTAIQEGISGVWSKIQVGCTPGLRSQ